MTTLLVGHTLAEGTPLGPTLREIGEPGAAGDAEAGQLDDCLRHLLFQEELRAMAQLWPAALRPALKRLSVLPSPLIFRLPMTQTLIYLMLISSLQGIALLVLLMKIIPVFESLGAEMPINALPATSIGLFFVAFLLPVGVGVSTRMERWGWSLHLRRARQAAMAAAMAASDAPAEVRRVFGRRLTVLSQTGASAAELDLVVAQSLSLAEQAHHRMVSAVRLVGLGTLILIAALVTANIYRVLAELSVPI